MELLLLNPNVAYVFLVLGTMLILLALVTPGTGILEVGAFFCLVIAGYTIYHLGFNWWALVIQVLSLVPFFYAIRGEKRKIALALSIMGIIAGSAYLIPGEGFAPGVNPILAIITSLLAGGFLWLIIGKTIQAHLSRPSHDLGRLIGMIGEAKTEIFESGSVQVAGELWSAHSEQHIAAGDHVRVLAKQGFNLEVEKFETTETISKP
ncbi:MAG: NfeD family protein [Chloroflexota bacterium]